MHGGHHRPGREAEGLPTLAEVTSPKVAVVPGEGEATGAAGGREAVGREGGLYQEESLLQYQCMFACCFFFSISCFLGMGRAADAAPLML